MLSCNLYMPWDNPRQPDIQYDIMTSDLWHTGSSRCIDLSDSDSGAGILCSYSLPLDRGRSVSSSLSCSKEDLSDMYCVHAGKQVAQDRMILE